MAEISSLYVIFARLLLGLSVHYATAVESRKRISTMLILSLELSENVLVNKKQLTSHNRKHNISFAAGMGKATASKSMSMSKKYLNFQLDLVDTIE